MIRPTLLNFFGAMISSIVFCIGLAEANYIYVWIGLFGMICLFVDTQ